MNGHFRFRRLVVTALLGSTFATGCVTYRTNKPVFDATAAAAVGVAAVGARDSRDAFDGIAFAGAAADLMGLAADLYFLDIDEQSNCTILWSIAYLRNLPESEWSNSRIEFMVPSIRPRYEFVMRRSRNRVGAPGIELEIADFSQRLLVKDAVPYHPNYIFWPDELLDKNPHWGSPLQALQKWLRENPEQDVFVVSIEKQAPEQQLPDG